MTFANRLMHSLIIERSTNGVPDDYNQSARSWMTHATVKGFPQPKSIREIAATTDAGAVVGDWTVFLEPSDLRESDRIVHTQSTCPVPGVHDLPTGYFQPTGVRNAAGIGHHLEVDATFVAPDFVQGS